MFSPLSLMRSRSSSTSSTSSTSSSSTFSDLKSSLSPPATTTSDFSNLLTSPIAPFTLGLPSTASVCTAYPSWPNRSSLAVRIVDCDSPTSATHRTSASSSSSIAGWGFACPSSHISDDDLLALDFSALSFGDEEDGAEIPGQGISWSATRQPEVVVAGEERRKRGPPPGMGLRVGRKAKGGRERSVSSGRRRGERSGGLGVIVE